MDTRDRPFSTPAFPSEQFMQNMADDERACAASPRIDRQRPATNIPPWVLFAPALWPLVFVSMLLGGEK